MKILATAILSFYILFECDAQQGRDIHDFLIIKMTEKNLYGGSGELVEGNPFLNENFTPGSVILEKEYFSEIPMRYNMFDDQIEFKQEGQVHTLSPHPSIKSVRIGDDKLMVVNYERRGKKQSGFLMVLDSGKVTLLTKRIINYVKRDEFHGIPARYTRGPEVFFYKIGNGEVWTIESVKKMISTFPDKHAELTQFAKKEKISARRDDLVRIIQYYNGL